MKDYDKDARIDRLAAEWLDLQNAQLARHSLLGNRPPSYALCKFDPGCLLDATDESLRKGSTNFGNLIADALERDSDIDCAMIHAGSFRCDQFIGNEVTIRDLFETFIFDEADALIVAEITRGEIQDFCTHAVGRAGSGAFLQIGKKLLNEKLSTDDQGTRLRVALPRYLLMSNQDGYQSLLSTRRRCRPESLLSKIGSKVNVIRSTSIIDVALKHLRSVQYDDSKRMAATVSGTLAWQLEFIERVRKLRDAYARYYPNEDDSTLIEIIRDKANPLRSQDPIKGRIGAVLRHVRGLIHISSPPFDNLSSADYVVEQFLSDLVESEKRWEDHCDYHRYLEAAHSYLTSK